MFWRPYLLLSCAVLSLLSPAARAETLFRADQVKATLKPYQVPHDLAGVVNARQLKASKAQRALLHKNLFVVTPTQSEQLFYIYENNDYGSLPSFVTTDLVLQLFHVFYDFTLRRIESRKLLPLARRLAKNMLQQSMTTYKQLPDGDWREAALHNVAYFGVAARLLGVKAKALSEAQPLIKKELALIAAHQGMAKGAIFPYQLDYSQFIVRGHYTRTRALRHYFQGMLWFGLCPFPGAGRLPHPLGPRASPPPRLSALPCC